MSATPTPSASDAPGYSFGQINASNLYPETSVDEVKVAPGVTSYSHYGDTVYCIPNIDVLGYDGRLQILTTNEEIDIKTIMYEIPAKENGGADSIVKAFFALKEQFSSLYGGNYTQINNSSDGITDSFTDDDVTKAIQNKDPDAGFTYRWMTDEYVVGLSIHSGKTDIVYADLAY